MVDQVQALAVFRAQARNVSDLEKAWKYLNRQLNEAIRTKNSNAVKITTKFLALNYCALAEAKFSKLIHTPHGLELSYVSQIKAAAHRRGVKEGWRTCVELALKSVPPGPSNHLPNVRQKIFGYVESYIFDPSQLRNKLAHGQWSKALNGDNTAENADLTVEIDRLDVTDLYRKKTSLDKLCAIVEDLIESPAKAHFASYWKHVTDLEEEMLEMSQWTLALKTTAILTKAAGAKCASCGRRI